MNDKLVKHLKVKFSDDFVFVLCNDESMWRLRKRNVYTYVLDKNAKFDQYTDNPSDCDCSKCLVMLDAGLTKDYLSVKKWKKVFSVKTKLSTKPEWETVVFKHKTEYRDYRFGPWIGTAYLEKYNEFNSYFDEQIRKALK